MVTEATERIVVRATSKEKKAIVEKARKLGIPISELMRRGARTYKSETEDDELGVVADAAKAAAERVSDFIDDALTFVEASNRRIAAMETKAEKKQKAVQ